MHVGSPRWGTGPQGSLHQTADGIDRVEEDEGHAVRRRRRRADPTGIEARGDVHGHRRTGRMPDEGPRAPGFDPP